MHVYTQFQGGFVLGIDPKFFNGKRDFLFGVHEREIFSHKSVKVKEVEEMKRIQIDFRFKRTKKYQKAKVKATNDAGSNG